MGLFTSRKQVRNGWQEKQLQAARDFLDRIFKQNPKWTNWTTEAAVREGYRASLWAYAAINKKAKAAASVPWYVYRQQPDGSWQKVDSHPLQQLIDKPNPFTSRNAMIERLIMQLDLAGNSLHHIVTVGGTAVELWNVNPDLIEPITDRQEFISGYKVKGFEGQAPVKVAAAEILHTMYIDPSNPYWGIAPLQVAARTVDTEIEAVNWNKVALQNRAVTDGIFSIKEPLSQQQYNELRKQVREQHQGADNARAPWILGAGAEWQQMSLSPADMDFIEGKRMTREEIVAIFQVPPPLVGILDRANYSNMQEARRVFWLDTIIPLLNDLREAFNRSLLPYFEPGIMLDYDTSGVDALAQNVNEKVDAANKLFNMGLPFNSINKWLDLGFDETEGGDVGYLPASMVPADMARMLSTPTAAPAEPDPPAAAEEEAAKKDQARAYRKSFFLQSEEQKDLHWKKVERRRAKWDLILRNEAIKIFDRERQDIVNAFKKSGGDPAAATRAIKKDRWRSYLETNYRKVIADFGQDTYDTFKSYYPAMERKDFDPYSEIILSYIGEVAAEKVVQITATTMLLTRDIIKRSQDENQTLDELARSLDRDFEEYSTHRAYRIARTEVAAASNFGSYAAAEMASEDTGDLVKEWIDSRDGRVRDSHRRINGEKVRFYSRFSNGLLYPGDMANGAAKDVIHCRCTIGYIPAAYVDPSEIRN